MRHILALCEGLRTATNGYFDSRAAGRLDPSGVVKGWSIDQASEILTTAGCPDHLIDGGGDVRLRGRAGPNTQWRVAVVHPLRLDAYCAALQLPDGAVATSGTYERGFHVPTNGRNHRGTGCLTSFRMTKGARASESTACWICLSGAAPAHTTKSAVVQTSTLGCITRGSSVSGPVPTASFHFDREDPCHPKRPP